MGKLQKSAWFFGGKREKRYNKAMNAPILPSVLWSPQEGSKHGVMRAWRRAQTEVNRRKNQISDILTPTQYKERSEIIDRLESVLIEALPWAKLSIIHRTPQGKYVDESRNSYPMYDRLPILWEDTTIWEGVVSGEDALYFPYKDGYIVAENVPKTSHKHMLRIVGSMMKSIRSNVEIVEAYNTDALTWVYNRNRYEKVALELNTIEKDTDIAVIMIDLDDFKSVNDHGHEIGDIALQKVAELMKRVLRHDEVYRIGGDEFSIIMKFPRGMSRDDRERIVKERMVKLDEAMKAMNSEDDKTRLTDTITQKLWLTWWVAYKDSPDEHFESIRVRADIEAISKKDEAWAVSRTIKWIQNTKKPENQQRLVDALVKVFEKSSLSSEQKLVLLTPFQKLLDTLHLEIRKQEKP
jgi:diguanylate cyclase (GGDEF)-like protein